MNFKFLKKEEFIVTKKLASLSFGEDADLDTYYEKDIYSNRVAVLEEGETIISMLHLKRVLLDFGHAYYILYVATDPSYRNKGYMKNLFKKVLEILKNEGEKLVFLVPVNKDIYKSLGFTNYWNFNNEERDLLYADDNLSVCAALMLDKSSFVVPKYILPDFEFKKFDEKAVVDYFDYFSIRPNKSDDSVPLDCFMWRNVINSEYCILDNQCLLMKDNTSNSPSACLPLCQEEKLGYYFKQQERYYNCFLKIPFCAYLTDSEGIEYLKTNHFLDNYEITEDKDIYDYIYDGNSLRTLSGKKLSNKRNRIHKLEKEISGWEYRTLSYENREEIIEFLNAWEKEKKVDDIDESIYGEEISTIDTLNIEKTGIIDFLNNKELTKLIKIGGIYIDGKLEAFSIGALNKKENMAVVEVEKANPTRDGLYQLINREFLLHEFPDAELVNREDDLGLPGLRQAKMSYNPIFFEKRYTIKQKLL